MAFGNNSTLISSATVTNIEANGTSNETFFGQDGRADAFVIADGTVGDDAITNFDVNDTIITGKKIFDGNNDGYIDFGPNNVLDVDRTGSGVGRAGEDQISVSGNGADFVTTIRYLGTKDGGFAYGAADVRDNFLGHFTKGFDNAAGSTGGDASVSGFAFKYDNQVADTTYDFGKGQSVLLLDNATGLNFGGDTITKFGNDDLLVTTSKLYDSDNSGVVTFGKNLVLDISGSEGPLASDPAGGPGGQLDLGATRAKSGLTFLGEKTIEDSTYYYYGTSHSTVDLSFA
ncbi:hypothetical protein [Sphingomonas solaris]|uniref:Uncharacterized protein n=1 Tax=Alterirhizorhabdus solaris TaxID=2529389 RepID=A0A558QVX1_9SPHN|nr:hypothetical protein [Sphingomonas solaris]TVV71268.1 hypothetical protein FOY91_17275 [Sphingomonas solaris]